MTFRWLAVPLIAPLLLGACGSDPTGTDPQQVLGQLVDVGIDWSRSESAAEAGEVRAETLTRADIAGVTLPLSRATIPAIGGAATAAISAVNHGVETWAAGDGSTFLLDGPVLFATRGIGWDLLAAETAAPRQLLLEGRSGSYKRTLRHIDGREAIDYVVYDCTMRQDGTETIVVLQREHRVRRATERCVAADGARFENVYWIGDGVLWRSRQWISERLGYIETERLVR